ncbi:6363_t:CDS:2, partial [Rhizophagus irregularis]
MNVNHEIINSSNKENEPINECFDSSDEENDFHYTIITVYLERYALQEGFSFKKTRVEYYLHQKEMKGLTADQKKLH